ncbi:MAG TPA: pyridoxamine 5'-phosphate oxidase family protein [Methylotenera sp.]|nr:pyridoxamine 5'-phosphate oxidase family protein [Methylotenera sp.]
MSDLYGSEHRALQKIFDTERLANAVESNIVSNEFAAEHKGFIESRDMFFLTTVDHRGYPTCSYKGGSRGFVKVLGPQTLAFPSYDGNGMFLSMGNIKANPQIGMLFIDFETPHRVRVHGTAVLDENIALLNEFPGAEIIVTVNLTEVFINCTRYIHKYQRVESSNYVPQKDCAAPFAQWKRIDNLQDSLPDRDKHIAEELGGTITTEQYVEMVMQGKA